MRQVSARRRKRDAGYGEAREQVFARSGGACEAGATQDCTGRCEQVHHRAGRHISDPHQLGNLLGVCEPCHRWVHGHPEEARNRGWSLSRHSDPNARIRPFQADWSQSTSLPF